MTSGSDDSVIFESGMVENMGVDVGIMAPSLAIQKLFPLPVWLSAILNFGSLSSSTNVDQRRRTSGWVLSVKSKSGVVENVGGSRWNNVCMLLETEVTSTSRKCPIFFMEVHLVFGI